MSAPRLTRALVLEHPQAAPDGAGGQAITWSALGMLWAEIRPGAGNERMGAMGPEAAQRLRITLRAAPAGSPRRPRPGQRLVEGPRRFRILAVAEADPTGRYLVCTALEEDPA
ncbi:head-tail adaptor protein [Rhodobacteraceae bacterium 2376]|uniref:Head-tail adaptor protein n=1 Tax=Rhabdonatronobacter sediminivivens TaxID=2743469 RepID=A0A7Z0HX73_9RHOB|nr:head-tail adaptor protein [Rhabdonatronobacter sediminivivens]NYS23968.1 head-tail adaptor protein [Rhabdonatronobacter sediminivivens]